MSAVVPHVDQAPFEAPSHSHPQLVREPDFHVLAWEEVQPYIVELCDQLVKKHGYSRISEDNDQFHSIINDNAHIHLPRILSTSKIPQIDPSAETVISLRLIRLHSLLPELVDIVSIIQCFLPGRFLVSGAAFDKGIPNEGWLAKNEALIRDTLGDSYFRHLWEAATKVDIWISESARSNSP